MSNRQSESPTLPRLSWDIGTAYDFFESLDLVFAADPSRSAHADPG
jgi:hypothetical protein